MRVDAEKGGGTRALQRAQANLEETKESALDRLTVK
jgi:hypothetical protein